MAISVVSPRSQLVAAFSADRSVPLMHVGIHAGQAHAVADSARSSATAQANAAMKRGLRSRGASCRHKEARPGRSACCEYLTVPDHLLAHTSPLGWSHISLTGDYLWEQAAIAVDGFRPLNTARSRLKLWSCDRTFALCPS